MYEQSHRDYLRSGLSASSSACHGLLIITVITPLPTKPSDKNARELKLANAAITDMQMRQRDVAARCKIHGEGCYDAKAENDALRDDVAAGVVGCTSKQSVSQCVKLPPPPAWIRSPPRLADTAERDYFTLRERLITMQTTGRNPEVY